MEFLEIPQHRLRRRPAQSDVQPLAHGMHDDRAENAVIVADRRGFRLTGNFVIEDFPSAAIRIPEVELVTNRPLGLMKLRINSQGRASHANLYGTGATHPR